MTQGKNQVQSTPQSTPRPKQALREGMVPWAPGQSGNPGGRPAMPPEVKAALAGASLDAVKKQIELMNCGDPRIELLASQALLDRHFGKAAQAIDKTVTTTSVQAAHLEVLMRIQAKHDEAEAKVIELDGGTAIPPADEG
jgi:hypothetical protein